MENTYNGWTNRVTWLTNLNLGDIIEENILNGWIKNEMELSDQIDELLEDYRRMTYNEIPSDILEIIQDFDQIDFNELYETVQNDIIED